MICCKDCSKQFDSRRLLNDHLVKHIVSFNHIEYKLVPKDEGVEKSCCCHYCGNVNIIILGTSSVVDKIICINCLGNQKLFSSYDDWKKSVNSWYPYILNNKLFGVLSNTSSLEKITYSDVRSYALALNQYYLSSLKKSQSHTQKKTLNLAYIKVGSGKRNITIMINFKSSNIVPSMCLSIKFNNNTFDGVVTYRKDNGDTYINVLEVYNFDFTSGTCTVTFPIDHWADPMYPINAGELLARKNYDNSLLESFAGHFCNPQFKQNALVECPNFALNPDETTLLSSVIKSQVSILECGTDLKRMVKLAVAAGYSLHNSRKKQVIYTSTNNKLLDEVSLAFDRVNKDKNVIQCFRVGNRKNTSDKASENSVYKHVITSMKERDPFVLSQKVIKTLNECAYLAMSFSEIGHLPFLHDYVVIILDAEYLSNVRCTGLLKNCHQMMFFTRKAVYDEAQSHVGGLVTARLVAKNIPVSKLEGDEVKPQSSSKPTEKETKTQARSTGQSTMRVLRQRHPRKEKELTVEEKPAEDVAEEKPSETLEIAQAPITIVEPTVPAPEITNIPKPKREIRKNRRDKRKESLKNKVEETKVEEPKVEEPKVEESKVEEPKVEEPKVEETKVEEPKVEEPEVEEPKVEEPKVEEPKVEEPKVEEPKVEEPEVEPKVEEPKAEEPKVEEPEVEEPKVEEPKVEETKEEEPKAEEPKVEEPKVEESTPDVKQENETPVLTPTLSQRALLTERVHITEEDERVVNDTLLSEIGFYEESQVLTHDVTVITPIEVPDVPATVTVTPEMTEEEKQEDIIVVESSSQPSEPVVNQPVVETKTEEPKEKIGFWKEFVRQFKNKEGKNPLMREFCSISNL